MSFFDARDRKLNRRALFKAFAAAAVLSQKPALAAGSICPAFPNPTFLQATKRGVNLTGWDVADTALRPKPKQLEALRKCDFTHIRLPVDNRRLEEDASYTKVLRDQIDQLVSQDFAVSVDLHADKKVGEFFRKDARQGEAYLTGLWNHLTAQLETTNPQKVAIELLNEPQLEQALWEDVAGRLILKIRKKLPDTTMIVGPSGPQRHETLADMVPFSDPNIIYAIHYYDPVLFTHQGANWGEPDDPARFVRGAPFPATLSDRQVGVLLDALSKQGQQAAADELKTSLSDGWNEDSIKHAFDLIAQWSRRHQCPVIINEFGVLSFVTPRKSRLRWLAAVNRHARERCLGWAHWDFQDGFGLIDKHTGMPDVDIMKALS